MRKIMPYLTIVAICIVIVFAYYIYSINNPKPKVERPDLTAEKILQLESEQKWKQLYAFLHPDIQAKISLNDFVDQISKEYPDKIEAFNVDRTNRTTNYKYPQNSIIYKEAAKIDYTVSSANGQKTEDRLYLAKAPDNTWRLLWWPKKTSQ